MRLPQLLLGALLLLAPAAVHAQDAGGMPVLGDGTPAKPAGTTPGPAASRVVPAHDTDADCEVAKVDEPQAFDPCAKERQASPSRARWKQCLDEVTATLDEGLEVYPKRYPDAAGDPHAEHRESQRRLERAREAEQRQCHVAAQARGEAQSKAAAAKRAAEAAAVAVAAAKQQERSKVEAEQRAKVEEARLAAAKAEEASASAQTELNEKQRTLAEQVARYQAVTGILGTSELRDQLRTELALLEAAADLGKQTADADCARDEIVCLDHLGVAVPGETVPSSIRAGLTVTVKVFLTRRQKEEQKEEVKVAFSQEKSLDVAFEPRAVSEKARSSPGFDASLALDSWQIVPFVADPVDAASDRFLIAATTRDVGGRVLARRNYELAVERGYSYYSVAILIAATARGDRTVRPDLTVLEDTAVEGAFALNVFPFGRPRGAIGLLNRCSWKGRCLRNMLGLTLATDIDLGDPFDRLYAGVILEPVAGLAFSAGASLRVVNLVPRGASLPEVGGSDDPVVAERGRVLRPYIGITMTLDLLETLAELKRKAGAITY